jgi:chemotaxis protein methyltransferase CheR
VNDTDCTAFLQWALPQLGLRWPGFRKVRRQVCKRVKQRMRDLGLQDFAAYRARLEGDPSEWQVLDECSHITISRFFRNKGIFDVVRRQVLPAIAARAEAEGRGVQIWSAGCASGEEPYTLKVLWDIEVASKYPSVSLSIIASDIDKTMIARAHRGCFGRTSLYELPEPLIDQAFAQEGGQYCIKPRYRAGIEFVEQDLRAEMPTTEFDLILCRYVAVTYFVESLQAKVLASMVKRLRPDGYLVIGSHEKLPRDLPELVALATARQIFQKKAQPERARA